MTAARGFSLMCLLLLALAACAGGSGDPVRPVVSIEPRLTGDAVLTEDGARLPLRMWLPDGKVTATIVAAHGFNDYSNAFAGPAAAWAKHGIATYAYDQRGFGAAPDRGLWVGARRLDQDLALTSRLVAERYPGVPHYLLGESMGGAVVMTAVTGAAGAERPVADGIILVAPAVWGRAMMNLFERAALWTADAVVPGMTVTGRGLDIWPSDNVAMLRALSRDPLVIKETRVDTLDGLVDLMDLALAAAPRIAVPTLLLYGQHDEIIPPRPIRVMVRALPADDVARWRVAWYPHGYHMLLRDRDARLVRRDIAGWMADRAAPLPSGADNNVGALLAAR